MDTGLPQRLGDFEITRELGRGGMGVVYEARQVSLNRKVALKLLGTGAGLSEKAVQRFRREAEAAARLHHSNIVPVYAIGEQDGVHFYAMEFIEGHSLDQVLRRQNQAPGVPADQTPSELGKTAPYLASAGDPPGSAGNVAPLSPDSGDYFDGVARMVAGVADALDHAHKQNILHRDIKPSNLLLSPDGRLSVTDFGLARILEEPGVTVTGEFVGTPAYMSPEQIAAGRLPIDHRTDVYSLGATLYEILTFRPPFTGASRDQLLAQIVQQDPPRPAAVNPKVPRDLETICLKCLEKDPARRYQTAGELADDLRRFVNRFAIRARRAGPLAKVWKWVRRNPTNATALVAVLVALGFTGYFAWQAHTAESRRKEELAVERRTMALEKAVTAVLNGENDEADRQLALAEQLGAAHGEVLKVRGIIALYQDKPEVAFGHLTEAAKRLDSPLAIRALLARAAVEKGDTNWDTLIDQLGPIEPRTADDFLFKGLAVGEVDDPRVSAALIKESIRWSNRSTPFPLAQLALAEVQFRLALDTGDEKDAVEAVTAADFARQLLPNSTQALATCICARLTLWDIYEDRKAPQFKARAADCLEVVRQLVDEGARMRFNDKLRAGCQYYHDRQGTGLKNAEKRLQRPGERFARETHAREMFRVGRDQEARESLKEAHKEHGSRTFIELQLWACLQETAEQRAAFFSRERQPEGPGFSFFVPAAALLLGQPVKAQELWAKSLKANRVPNWHNGWYQALARYGAAELTEEELLGKWMRTSRFHRCEGNYYVALHHLARGDRKRARQHFEEAVKTRVFFYVEHELSRAFLQRMEANPDWPPWIPLGQ